ncbi:hypothetical protein THOG05_10386 [Vibrio rotiferianus]|nr:hypothetical protein THOG05_10386 [Vibrio rotiferianus]
MQLFLLWDHSRPNPKFVVQEIHQMIGYLYKIMIFKLIVLMRTAKRAFGLS